MPLKRFHNINSFEVQVQFLPEALFHNGDLDLLAGRHLAPVLLHHEALGLRFFCEVLHGSNKLEVRGAPRPIILAPADGRGSLRSPRFLCHRRAGTTGGACASMASRPLKPKNVFWGALGISLVGRTIY